MEVQVACGRSHTWNELLGFRIPRRNKSQRAALLHHEIRLVRIPIITLVFSRFSQSENAASFNCPLVDGLSYCPGVSWAVPLPAPPNSDTTYNSSNLPTDINDALQQYIANFTVALTTFACGRDIYSPIQSCADCQREYRRWMCTVSFPRCGEPRGDEGLLERKATLTTALAGPTDVPRNLYFPRVEAGFVELLPCLERCQATDRACPNHVGFQCPLKDFNAHKSYGVGFIDSGAEGVEGRGRTGVSQDLYGNVWCNSG